jgi:hypothetical protein
MQELIDYIVTYAERGACQCGKCIDAPANPELHQPNGHTADVGFFKVKARDGADAEKLKQLIKANKQGEFCEADPFDGAPHSFIELGAWLGDQGLALMLMGLGAVLGLWRALAAHGVVVIIPNRPTA